VQTVCYKSNCGISYSHLDIIADLVKLTMKKIVKM